MLSLGALPAGLQMLDRLRRDEHATQIGAVLAAAMEVTAARWDEIEFVREREAARGHLGRVRPVVGLDAGQTNRDQLRQQRIETDHRPGMRERWDPAVLPHKRYGFKGIEPDARDIGRRVLGDKRVECIVVAWDVALLEERLREVWAAERSTLCDLKNACELHRVAEGVQLLDHELDPLAAVLAEPAEPLLERRIRGVDEVAEDVGIAPLGFGVELSRRNDAHAEVSSGRDSIGDSRQRVVIGKRLDLDAARGGTFHEVRWRERAVRAKRMRVQVDRVSRGYGCHSLSKRSIERARPVSASISITTLLNWTMPEATSKRRGR